MSNNICLILVIVGLLCQTACVAGGNSTSNGENSAVEKVVKAEFPSPLETDFESEKTLFSICVAVLMVMSCAVQSEGQDEILFPVRENGKMGFGDKSGKVVIPYQFDEVAETFSEGMIAVKSEEKWGYIDSSGKFVIKPQFDRTSPFKEGLAFVESGEKSGFIDKTGKLVIPLESPDYLAKFSEGLAKVKKNNKFGFIDKTGKFVIETRYEDAEDFNEGLAAVRLDGFDGKYGFIDKTGKTVIPFKFNAADWFSEGHARVAIEENTVESNAKSGYIDKTGTVTRISKDYFDSQQNLLVLSYSRM